MLCNMWQPAMVVRRGMTSQRNVSMSPNNNVSRQYSRNNDAHDDNGINVAGITIRQTMCRQSMQRVCCNSDQCERNRRKSPFANTMRRHHHGNGMLRDRAHRLACAIIPTAAAQ